MFTSPLLCVDTYLPGNSSRGPAMSDPMTLGKSLRHLESLRVFSCTISGFVVRTESQNIPGGLRKASGTGKLADTRNAWLRLWAALRLRYWKALKTTEITAPKGFLTLGPHGSGTQSLLSWLLVTRVTNTGDRGTVWFRNCLKAKVICFLFLLSLLLGITAPSTSRHQDWNRGGWSETRDQCCTSPGLLKPTGTCQVSWSTRPGRIYLGLGLSTNAGEGMTASPGAHGLPGRGSPWGLQACY